MINARAFGTDVKEIKSVIIWTDNFETETKYFNTCEGAWNWYRDTTSKAANRRAKTDRRFVLRSYYVGATRTGKTYGGSLGGIGTALTKQEIEHEALSHAIDLKRTGFIEIETIDESFFRP